MPRQSGSRWPWNDVDGRVIQIIPGTGWIAWYRDDETGEIYPSPLVAWGLTEAGNVVPLDADSSGYVDDPMPCRNLVAILPLESGPPTEDKATRKREGEC